MTAASSERAHASLVTARPKINVTSLSFPYHRVQTE